MNEKRSILSRKIIGCLYCNGRCRKCGFTKNKKVRYRCLNCGKTFIHKKMLPLTWKDFVDFYRLIKGQTNRLFPLEEKEIGRSKLSFQFKTFFDLPLSTETVWNLLPPKLLYSNLDWVYGTDGKWLRKSGVLMNHRNVTNGENLWWSYHKSESYEAYYQDLLKLSGLLRIENLPSGAISDWNGGGVAWSGQSFWPHSASKMLDSCFTNTKTTTTQT